MLLVLIVFVFNLVRNLSTELPQQLGDEALFLLTAKFFPNSETVHSIGYTPYPGIVFLKIASVFANSEQYYQWMKTWNAACFALAAAPAYLIARTLMPQSDARIGAVIIGITPPSIYGAYFTAEATYILAFWIFSAAAIGALRTPHRHGLAALTGATGAIAYLVKPHGVALAIAYLVSAGLLVLLAQLRRKADERPPSSRDENQVREEWTPRALLINVTTFAFAAIAVLLVLGKALRGEWFAALDLGVYGNLTDGTAQRAEQNPGIAAVAFLVALHVAAVAAALAIPCAL
ncbi:MAG TPA: hypothetical protein VLI21_17365, partial [Casimicrobiaceae bacterium]|nr:hypothetical protein [Casimicrobiaceae bacterium]